MFLKETSLFSFTLGVKNTTQSIFTYQIILSVLKKLIYRENTLY